MGHDLFLIVPLGLIMGFVTAVSGGAGVFAVPTMLALGIPPINVLALNRISDLGVLGGAVRNYVKAGGVNWTLAAIAALPLAIGAYFGAHFSISVAPETLSLIIIGAVIVGIIFLLWPVRPDGSEKKPNLWLGLPALCAVGFWSGALGMAGATFGTLVFVLLFHRSYLSARSIDIIAVVPETIVSVVILTLASTLDWTQPLAMLLSSLAGAYIGSKMAIKKGSQFIRYSMIGISIVMIGKVILSDVLHLF